MKISLLTSLTLASSLVSAKLYVVDRNGSKNDVVIPSNFVLNRSSFKNDLEKNNLDETLELRFDKANIDDLLALSEEFFHKDVLTARQVVDLVINEKIKLFDRVNKKINKSKKRSKLNLLENAIIARLDGVMEKLPEISPVDAGEDKDNFVAALPVAAYQEANPATVLLSENAIVSEAAIATLFNLTEDLVEKFLQQYLGLDQNTIGIINKVTKIVAKVVAKIIKFTGPDRIFKIFHQLTVLLYKVPVLGGLVAPRLEALGQGIVLYVANLDTELKKSLKRAGRKSNKLKSATGNERLVYDDLASLVFGRSMKNGEEFVDQGEEGGDLNFTRKQPVNDNIEIEIGESNALPAHRNNNNNNNIVRFGRPARRQHDESSGSGRHRRHHRRHQEKTLKSKLIKGGRKGRKSSESSHSSGSSSSTSSSGEKHHSRF